MIFQLGKSQTNAACLKKDDGKVGYSGPTFITIRSAKHDRSCEQSYMEDFNSLISCEEFKEASMNGDEVKPLVFISLDGGPDEAPKNEKTMVSAIQNFTDHNIDALFTHAPGSSAYNKVERRMAPLSKFTAGIMTPPPPSPIDTFGSHLDSSNNTVDEELVLVKFLAGV